MICSIVRQDMFHCPAGYVPLSGRICSIVRQDRVKKVYRPDLRGKQSRWFLTQCIFVGNKPSCNCSYYRYNFLDKRSFIGCSNLQSQQLYLSFVQPFRLHDETRVFLFITAALMSHETFIDF